MTTIAEANAAYLRHRSCERKTRYPSPKAARLAAQRRRRLGSVRLRHYECDWCGGWHLTKKGWST
jgi:hypothetical protein